MYVHTVCIDKGKGFWGKSSTEVSMKVSKKPLVF